MFKEYLFDLFKTINAGNVREESYYPDLKKLIEAYATQNKKEITVTVLPKKTEAGNPDFRIQTQKYQLVGYIEAKEPNNENLDVVEQTEQLQRYLKTFPNLILTNFLEFRLYRNGEQIDKVIIGRPFILNQLGVTPPVENELYLQKLLAEFFSFSTPKINTAKTLAIELAKRTSFLKENCVVEELKEETLTGTQTLEGIYKLFKEYLISSLNLEDFANLFSQTITFGLFAARLRSSSEFNRFNAFKTIPSTIGILKNIFRFISSNDLPKNMEWIIDDIAELLKNTDVTKIVDNYYLNGKGKDPIIHFYETFLAEYDPKERAKRGVYYTPEPVVKYIVNSVHKILQKKFKRPDGLASNSVTLLDPAAGTLTFPIEAIKVAVEEYKNRYGDGGVQSLIKNHIVPHFFAFELMMSPYVLGHIKASLIFDENNYKLGQYERFNLFLTNTLDLNNLPHMDLPLFSDLSEESRQANDIKKNKKVMVIVGNPPYSAASTNKGDWILEKINEYRQIEGEKLNERKDWLQDDYVKFFRFSQWKIEQNKQGVLGFITNHAWLDNPTFRGMRCSILNTFNEIYVVNLHGSILKKEKTSEGNKDENVFDIQTGVSIVLMCKTPTKTKQVFYCDKRGLREDKYKWLESNNITTTKWQKLVPSKPYYFLVPRNEEGNEEYQKFIPLTDIFNIYSTGVLTANDNFVIDFDKHKLETRINSFINSIGDNEFIKNTFNLSKIYSERIPETKLKLKTITNISKRIVPISYRIFDIRYIFYDDSLVWRTRKNVMKNMSEQNICLLSSRMTKGENFAHAFVTNLISEVIMLSPKTSNNSFVFPLFSYFQNNLLNHPTKSSNLNWSKLPNFVQQIPPYTSKLSNNFIQTNEAIFYYIYAILYSNIYRKKYKEFLKVDFPRIPFVENLELFQLLSSLGEELINLHLLKSSDLDNPTTKFFGQGEGKVNKRKYNLEENRIYINDSQYFDDVAPDIWNYYIGGYQVLDKWLKDRINRTLSDEDIRHYCKVATVLKLTKEIQTRIDKVYLRIEEEIKKSTKNHK